MAKFKTQFSFPFVGKDLHLLNMDFYKMEFSEKVQGRHSSYHQEEEFKVNWARYLSLPIGEILICSSAERYSFDEAMSFMASKNGIGLTRDNLFAFVNLRLEQILIKRPSSCTKICAFMGEDFLPKHLSYKDRRICPSFEIDAQNPGLPISMNNKKVDYDWSWIDEEFSQNCRFAFFVPSFNSMFF